MDINKVIPSLRVFVKMHANQQQQDLKNSEQKILDKKANSLSGHEWAALDKNYWNDFSGAVPSGRIRLYEALETGLEKYYDQLCDRQKLIHGNQGLKRQNE